MDSKEKIGKKVWHIRRGLLKTQEEFSELIDTTPETVSNVERGVVLPSLQTVANIAEQCGVSTDYLIGVNKKE